MVSIIQDANNVNEIIVKSITKGIEIFTLIELNFEKRKLVLSNRQKLPQLKVSLLVLIVGNDIHSM